MATAKASASAPVRVRYPTDAEIDAARERGRLETEREPRATAAHYDRAADALTLWLRNDVAIVLHHPRTRLQELADATPAQLERVQVLGAGGTLVWDEPNVAVSIAGLIAEMVGPEVWQREVARSLGARSSPKKAAASAKNGVKGGRPRKGSAKSRTAATKRKRAKVPA